MSINEMDSKIKELRELRCMEDCVIIRRDGRHIELL